MNDHGAGATSHSGIDAPSGVFPYPGSKGQLASWIIEDLPDHETFVEAFGGSAAVTVQKPESYNEIINDRDGDIAHFFETLRDRHDELVEWCKQTPFSRDLHRKYANQFYAGYRPDDSIERAGRFFYIRNTQFAQKYTGISGFRLAVARNHATQYLNRVDDLKAFAKRLRRVQVENLDYGDLVGRVDTPETLFYFDPPYVDVGDDLYSHGAFDHERFVNVLESIEGYWICSYTDLPAGLEEYYCVEQNRRGTMRTGQADWSQENTERLVMNFHPAETPKFIDTDHQQQTLLTATDQDLSQSESSTRNEGGDSR